MRGRARSTCSGVCADADAVHAERADVELLLVGPSPIERKELGLASGDTERREPGAIQIPDHAERAGLDRGGRRFGNPGCHDPHAGFADSSGRASRRVAHDPIVLRSLLVDAKCLQRAAVEKGLVVRRLQQDRVVGRDFIELLTGERLGVVRELLDRPSTQVVDPFARCNSLGARAKLLERGGAGAHAVPTDFPLPGGARTQKVHVVVDQPGNDRAPAEVDAARGRSGQFRDLRIAPDGDNAVAANGHGLSDRETLIDRDDLAVGDDDVRPGGLPRRSLVRRRAAAR